MMSTMSTSKVRATYHHGELREALLRAALELLEEGSAETLTLRGAARRAGVSPMAPYRHFTDKAALLAAVAAHGFHQLAGRLGEADASAEGREALIRQGVAYVAFAREAPRRFRLMFGTLDRTAHPDLAAASDAAFQCLACRVADLVDEPGRQDVTLACWSLVHGLASLAVEDQVAREPDTPEALTRRVTSLLLCAL